MGEKNKICIKRKAFSFFGFSPQRKGCFAVHFLTIIGILMLFEYNCIDLFLEICYTLFGKNMY